VKVAWSLLQPFLTDLPVWQTDIRMDRQEHIARYSIMLPHAKNLSEILWKNSFLSIRCPHSLRSLCRRGPWAFDWYKIDDLGWPWTAISSNFLRILRFFAFLGGKNGQTNEDIPSFKTLNSNISKIKTALNCYLLSLAGRRVRVSNTASESDLSGSGIYDEQSRRSSTCTCDHKRALVVVVVWTV